MTFDNTTIIIIILVVAALLFYLSTCKTAIHNDGSLQMPKDQSNEQTINNNNDNDSDNMSSEGSSVMSDDMSTEQNSSMDSSLEIIAERARGLNNVHARERHGGKYVKRSYKDLNSGTTADVDRHFDVNNVSENHEDRFRPVSNEEGAPINIGPRKENDKYKYHLNSHLPQEENKDWFETIQPVSVKNSHLLNIYRPVGVNSMGTAKRLAIYDIRGTDKAICPKYVVSPWLQSSIEPDRSTKSLCA